MSVIYSILSLIGLFAVLGISAVSTVTNIKKISHALGIPIFLLGMILGILTSLPELSIAINASINGIEEVSVGNLFGGMLVVFGLILGLSLILNRKVKTDGKIMTPLPGLALLLLPLVCSLDGTLSFSDGLCICVAYLLILVHMYFTHRHEHHFGITIVQKKKVFREILLVIGGILVIVASSSMIIKITGTLLLEFAISQFMVGLILFSLGTNLPELTIIITSWRKKVNEISFSHLLGSAMVNALILGMMALFSPLAVTVDRSFMIVGYFLIIMSVMLLFFYHSHKQLSRTEGVFLVLLFVIFGYIQIMIQ